MGRVDLTCKLADTRARVASEPSTGRPSAPFESLVRKEARVRDDQYTALTTLAKMLMSRRIRKAERIIENTLIRVAIDLLLERADQLPGATESELRNSASFRLRDSGVPHLGTPDLPNSQTSHARFSRSRELPELGGSCHPEIRTL